MSASASGKPKIVASLEKQAPFSTRQNNYAYPYAPPMPYDRPEQFQQDYNEMMAERRRAYEQTMQARREHMIKMHQYRAAVQKRIAQDRQDIYKRMKEIEWENQRRRDELMDRLEQENKRSMNRPI